MKTLVVPLVLGLAGLAIGAGAGWMLRTPHEPEEATASARPAYAPAPANLETMRMPNHFVVPVLDGGRVASMMVLSLALELADGHGVVLAKHEPRLRSVFLQVLFDHANRGGFEGVFTTGEALITLRRALRDAARAEFGTALHDVLITEILRQES
jgi:flagellar protein FliL